VQAARELVEITELRADDCLFHCTLRPDELGELGLGFGRLLLDHLAKLSVGSELPLRTDDLLDTSPLGKCSGRRGGRRSVDDETRGIVARNWPHLLSKLPPEED